MVEGVKSRGGRFDRSRGNPLIQEPPMRSSQRGMGIIACVTRGISAKAIGKRLATIHGKSRANPCDVVALNGINDVRQPIFFFAVRPNAFAGGKLLVDI